jgi:hypothetical protein
VRECHVGLLRIRLLLKNTKTRRLSGWEADVRRANGVRRQLVCMLSRMVRVRDRIVKATLKRADRALRDCKHVSCRRRALRRLAAVRGRVAYMLQVSRDAVVSSKGVKAKCVRILKSELTRERRVVNKVVKVTQRIVKKEKKAIKKARAKLLSCTGARCVSQQRHIVRREKRVLRVAKKEVSKAKKVVRKLVVKEIGVVNKLKQKAADCASKKCRRGVRKVIELEKSVIKAVTLTASKAKRVVKKVVAKVSTDVESRCEALRITISTHSLERNLCGKDRVCRHRHSALMHTAMADLIALKDCLGPMSSTSGVTTKPPVTTVRTTGSVARDACDDEIAEWNTDREDLNRRIAAAYTEAAECPTSACTQLALVALKKLHESAHKLSRPKCALTFFVDTTKGPVTSGTTKVAGAASTTGSIAAKAGGATAGPVLPTNIKYVDDAKVKPGRGQIHIFKTPIKMTFETKK